MNDREQLRSPENFQAAIDGILNRRLTPETIDSYATTALNDLIIATSEMVNSYDKQPTIAYGESIKDAEDSAYAYFGLDDLESSLDHVATLAGSIQKLDSIIEASTVIDQVIVPPDVLYASPQLGGNAEFIDKKIINRLKTTLFILEQDYEIDIHDPAQLHLTTGVLGAGMFRRNSYYVLDIPELARTMLICDEEGNATYVFDSDLYKGEGADSGILMGATKQDLNDLIAGYPGIGQRIIYSEQFITHVKIALSEPMGIKQMNGELEVETRYLKKNERVNYSSWSNEDIIALALDISPDIPLTETRIHTLSNEGLFLGASTTRKRFGSLVEFQRLCGFEFAEYTTYTNEQLVALALDISPDIPLTEARIHTLGKEGLFLGASATRKRFGSLVEFQRLCGFGFAEYTTYTNEQLVALALEISPDIPLTETRIHTLGKEGLFLGVKATRKRFGSIVEFQRLCGFEFAEYTTYTNEQLVALALEISPDIPLTETRIHTLNKEGLFLGASATRKRFGSIVEFQRLCGFEFAEYTTYTNEQLVALALEISPDIPLTVTRIHTLSKEGLFLGAKSTIKRFGSIVEFQRLCGF